MPITIDPSSISIGSDAAVVIYDDDLREKIRAAFADRARDFSPSFAHDPNLACTNDGNCAGETNMGRCINTGVCFF
jgi:hypothetical protein